MNLKSIKYFDIHTHVNFAAFDNDRDEVIKRAQDAGVGIINVGVDKKTSEEVVKLAHQNDGMFAIVGQHPSPHGELEDFDYDFYKKLANDPKVVAIGECGLDYFRHDTNTRMETNDTNKTQEKIFRKQIELAIEVNKPLMLHVRNGPGRSAYRDALSILESSLLNHKSTLSANFHFFAGSWDEAKAILDAGFYISFDGPITFARNYDEVIKNTPLDRIMSETDAPFATPAPYRGKRNEPAYVIEVVKKIAEIRGEDFEKVRVQLVKNTRSFFDLKLF